MYVDPASGDYGLRTGSPCASILAGRFRFFDEDEYDEDE
jgi:hypothetical protein